MSIPNGYYPRAIGDSPPPSPTYAKKSNSRNSAKNSLISTIDRSTEIFDPNRGTVKVELNCGDPKRKKVIFPMGPFTMKASAWPGEDYAAHGFVFKDECWQFPDSSLPTRIDPESLKNAPPMKVLSGPVTPKRKDSILDKLKRVFGGS